MEVTCLQHTNGSKRVGAETWWKRENILPAVALVVLTAVAWVYIADQASSMGDERMAGAMTKGVDLALFLFSWVVMMLAMMLPATLPLILLYRVVAHKRSGRRGTMARTIALLTGYIGIWTMAGLPVYAYTLVGVGAGSRMVALPGLLLIGAGIYQFTALKRNCHIRCSNPLFFLMEKWRPGAVGALRLGMLHGIDCLGCCVGLMIALVALGMMNLALMLSAAVIIFIEKTLPSSHRVARPLGVVLIATGVGLLVVSLRGGMAAM